jgi:hypothetical protein
MQSGKGKLSIKNKPATQDNEKKDKPRYFASLGARIKRTIRGKGVVINEQENKSQRDEQGATATELTHIDPPVKAAERSSCGPPQLPSATPDEAVPSKSDDIERIETVRVDESSKTLLTSAAETNATMSGGNLERPPPEDIASITVVEAPTTRAPGTVDQNQLDTPSENTETLQPTLPGDNNSTPTIELRSPPTTSPADKPAVEIDPSTEGKLSQVLRAGKEFQSAVKELQNIVDKLANDDPKLKCNAIEIHKLDEPNMNSKEIWSTIDILMDKQDAMAEQKASIKEVARKWFQACVPTAKVCLDIIKVCPKVT